ncbi:MAG: hypothetical protein AAFZ09_06325, partial [Pseudomonadota bacterium]
RLAPVSVRVREWEGEVIFLHELAPGAADRSYGVQVARLAGLPAEVVERARTVLDRLEARERGDSVPDALAGLPLFAAAGGGAPPARGPAPPAHEAAGASVAPAPAPPPSAVEIADRLAALDPDAMTPREALDALYELKALAVRHP